jgi:capsular polysaccharide biosynthesis protein
MSDGDVGGARTPAVVRDDRPERRWFDDGALSGAPADLGAGLVSLGFIRAAVGRSRRVWGGFAAFGLLVGMALFLSSRPVSQASTTLLLNVGPEASPGTAILNDQAIAQSRGVAELALQKLQLRQSVDSLLGSYAASVVTDRVLRIDVSAPTTDQAVRRANVLAAAFLEFRADQLETQQNLQIDAFDQELAAGEHRVDSIKAQISRVAAQPDSRSQQAQLHALRTASDHATKDLTTLDEQVSAARATAQQTTAAMVGQSRVLDAASPLPPPSRLKTGLLYGGGGFIVCLALGVGGVIIRALVSDHLRGREDVSFALGTPVKLSVAAKRGRVWRRRGRGLAAAKRRDIQRVASFLSDTLPARSPSRGLAVVPVDDTDVAAMSLVSLAVSCAQQHKKVVVADLCSRTPVARLVGVKRPGVHGVSVDGADLTVVVPDPHDVAPVGPFGPTWTGAGDQAPAAREVADAGASADVVLVLVALDPAIGSEHLRSWAADAVVVVTAGRSSWTKIHAVGELVRLAGARLISGVLLGSDKWDESLGVSAGQGVDGGGALATANGTVVESTSEVAPMARFIGR